MKRIKFFLIILALIILYVIVYKAFFQSGSLVWGDSPYFYLQNLKELFYEPLMWNFRNNNFGTSQAQILWLFIPTFLYGVLNHFFGLTNDFLIRIIFYFPATIFSIIGAWIFMGKFTTNVSSKLIASCFYGFNTYFLSVLDGGQLGVALAYGLFPFVIISLLNFLSDLNIKNYCISTFFLFLITNVDLRIAILVVFLCLLWELFNLVINRESNRINRILIALLITIISVVLLDSFWLIPFISNLSGSNINSLTLGGSDVQSLVSLQDSFLIFQPHFPLNEFGKISTPPLYFFLLPILAFFGLFLVRNIKDLESKRYLIFGLMFIILVFLAKGTSQPFGFLYSWMINNIPLGVSFRDSSKFYIPLILTTSILLGFSYDIFCKQIKQKYLAVFIGFSIYGFIFLLIYPAFTGGLTGSLKPQTDKLKLDIVSKKISSQEGFLRTLWFPERPPLAYSDWHKEAISANTLYEQRPFAQMIKGQYDLFYYLHNPLLVDWLRTLGIKYVFFPRDFRKKTWSEQNIKERMQFISFINSIPGFKKLNWNLNYPAFEITNSKDRIYTQSKAIIVLGGSDVYSEFKKSTGLELSNNGFIFLEDGITNPLSLLNLPKDSAVLVTDESNINDLKMSFLQNNFTDLSKNEKTNWGIFASGNYLSWKYELEKNNIYTSSLDYNRSVAYSSIAGEEIKIRLSPKQKGEYYLAIRHINGINAKALSINFNSNYIELTPKKDSKFRWDILGPFYLNSDNYVLDLKNLGGFQAINLIALVEKSKMDKANIETSLFKEKFKTISLENNRGSSISAVLKNNKENVSYVQKNPTNYEINITSNKPTWLIFTDNYNKGWILKGNSNEASYPIYSMVNGYWIDKTGRQEFNLEYLPQRIVKKSILTSIIVLIIILLVLVAVIIRRWYSLSKKGF